MRKSVCLAIVAAMSLGAFGATHTSSAAGFMSTARDAEGRWWLVDGAGNRTLEMGVGWVSPRGPRNTVTGTYPYWETTKAKYAAPGAWEVSAVARLKAWGRARRCSLTRGRSSTDIWP